ncbi:MAG TPA: response regulator [Polyangiaceae bacterium LLY-WYZ-14_1]|jgi:two-component system chemotaxis response regulator CheY|nr:response regulator [Polyangiaceae bacterium LLY-WYZ-14_1]
MKVLVVDDSKAMRMILRRGLRQAGFSVDVQEADSGAAALDAIETAKPDLVICDWNMPEMTGIELLETLGDRGLRVRFGFVTTEGSPEQRARATEAGAAFLLTKPFTPDALKATLSPILG